MKTFISSVTIHIEIQAENLIDAEEKFFEMDFAITYPDGQESAWTFIEQEMEEKY